MASEEEKGKIEIRIFKHFAEAAGLNCEYLEKQLPEESKPDLKCVIDGVTIYFELTEACSEDVAKALANIHSTSDPAFMRVKDDTSATYKKKIAKRYAVEEPIELLIYNIGRTIRPDNVLIENLKATVAEQGKGQFRKVWYFGETPSEL